MTNKAFQSPNEYISSLYHKCPAHIKTTFKAALLIGVITHFWALSNTLLNGDALLNGPYAPMSFEVSIGRWGDRFFPGYRSSFAISFVSNFVAVMLLSLSSALISYMLKLTNRLSIILCAGCIMTWPTVAANFAMPMVSDLHTGFSYLLAVTCALFCICAYEDQKSTFIKCVYMLLSVISGALSLSIYQAYITVAAAVLYVKLLLLADKNCDWKQILRFLLMCLVVGVASLLMYFLGLKIILWVLQVPFQSYRGFGESSNLIDLIPSIKVIKSIYVCFFSFFLQSDIIHNTIFRKVIGGVILGTIYCFGIWSWVIRKNYKLLLFLLLMPIALCPLVFVLGDAGLNIYMLPQMSIVFIITPALLSSGGTDNYCDESAYFKLTEWSWTLGTLGIVVSYFILANILYANLTLMYEKTYSIALRVIDRVEQLTDYRNDYPIVIVGGIPNSNYPSTNIMHREALQGFVADNEDTMLYWNNSASWKSFWHNYCGVTSGVTTVEEVEEIISSSMVANMPCFPSDGSVAIVEDVIVVKLS